jgi:CDP-diacylglycerol---serine O-phosphatidyltransferase
MRVSYHRKENEGMPSAMRRRRLGRSVFILPSLFTVGNIFCGYFAILSTMNGNYARAAEAIGIAIILDMLDGRIARLTHSTSDFGLQLDSLADVISFGIAPSILALVWGLSALDNHLAWMAAFTFTICGAMRLARFNIQAGELRHFVGLPIPAGGGAIAATVYFFGEPLRDPFYGSIMMGFVFLISLLMVSTIRYSSLKQLTLGRKSHLTILVIALLVALVYNYSRQTYMALAICYCASGIVMRLYGMLRRKRQAGELTLANPLEHH